MNLNKEETSSVKILWNNSYIEFVIVQIGKCKFQNDKELVYS